MDRDRLRDSFRQRPLSEVVDTLCEVEALRRAVHATELEAIADIEARQGWRADGCNSMVDWLCFRLSMTRKTAHELLDTARATEDLPHLAEAFGSGELSWDKTKAVAAMASSESEKALVEDAKTSDVRHLETAARRARAVTLQDAEERHRVRFFSMRRSIAAGGVRLSGFLPDVDGETVIKAIERLADDVPKDADSGLYPRFDERCADALVDLASGYLSSEQPRHAERAMVVTHVDLCGDAMVAECESGMSVAPETATRLMCDAVVEAVLEKEGRAVDVGAKHRFPPGWMRRQLIHRDVMCRFPGCTRAALVHAHHVTHWPKGPTQPDNLLMLCRYHHRKVHEGGWSIRGNPETSVEFIKPNGEALVSDVPQLSDETRKRILGQVLPDG